MFRQLVVRPTSAGGLLAATPRLRGPFVRQGWWSRKGVFWASAAFDSRKQNHYAVLGVSRFASASDIKKAYRLLARKWHPDVNKDSRADEVFKSIHLAYQVLSNEVTRAQYDRAIKADEDASGASTGRNIYCDSEVDDEIRSGASTRRNTDYDSEVQDEIRRWRWSELRRKRQKDRYRQRYYGGENFSSYAESDEESVEERGSFIEVLQYTFLSLFLMQTVGCQLSLMFSSLTAFLDRKLDGGYKLGYFIAWMLGGRGGVLLSLCLLFTSWACGKSSSSTVTIVVVTMWVASNLLSYTPFPRGAVLALLYLSVKLHIGLD